MAQNPQLFAGPWLDGYLNQGSKAMAAEINALGNDEILNINIPECSRQLAEKYRLTPVTLRDPVIADHGEKRVPGRGIISFVIYAIPFDGDAEILRRRVDWLDKKPPPAELCESEREMRIEVNSAVGGANEMKAAFERTLKALQEHLKAANDQVNTRNKYLESSAQNQIRERRAKLLKHSKLVQDLGTPVRPVAPPPATCIVPLPRHQSPLLKATSAATNTTAAPGLSQPDPTISAETYEHIIKIIHDAGIAMERAPESFEDMNEGQLRDQILMVLNSHYPGKATAETFNKRGRTDILVTHEGHHIFIGECKIWDGSYAVQEAIQQIHRYTTWRDTKSAIILFTRKHVSVILDRISKQFRDHQKFLRQDAGYVREGALRFIMTHDSDAARTLIVTVLIFQLARKKAAPAKKPKPREETPYSLYWGRKPNPTAPAENPAPTDPKPAPDAPAPFID